jgi:hypothetical protein
VKFNRKQQLMHKRLVADLMSLAHEILTLKNKEDIFALKEKATELHEKISVLAFVEEYINTTPNLEETKEEVTEKAKAAIVVKETKVEEEPEKNEEKVVHNLEETQEKPKEEETKEIQLVVEEEIEQPFDELEEILFSEKKEEKILDDKEVTESTKTNTLEDELKDTISIDVAANLFDIPAQKSLNDKLVGTINIGLNDRIAFVKHLFNGSQEDYNRVVSQLNTFKTEKEAKKFLNKMVKPDYDWSKQEELETRFMEIIERKFV